MVLINGKDITLWNAHLEEGNYPQLLAEPEAKEGYRYDWPDENGVDYDTAESVVYKTQRFIVSFLFSSRSLKEWAADYEAFLSEIRGGQGFDMQFMEIGKDYRLSLISTDVTDIGLYTGKMKVTVIMENRWADPEIIYKYLTDKLGRYITVNNKRVLVRI